MNNFSLLMELICLLFLIVRCDGVINNDIKPLLIPSVQRITTENEYNFNSESPELLRAYSEHSNVISTFFSSIVEYYRDVSSFFQTNTDFIFKLFDKIYAYITGSFSNHDLFGKLFTWYGGSLTNPTYNVSGYDNELLSDDALAFTVSDDTLPQDITVQIIECSSNDDIDEEVMEESPMNSNNNNNIDNQQETPNPTTMDQCINLHNEPILPLIVAATVPSEESHHQESTISNDNNKYEFQTKTSQDQEHHHHQKLEKMQQEHQQQQLGYRLLGEGSNSNDEYMGRYWHKGTFSTSYGNPIATSAASTSPSPSVSYPPTKSKEIDAISLPYNSWGQRSHVPPQQGQIQQQQSSSPSTAPLLMHLAHPFSSSLNRSSSSSSGNNHYHDKLTMEDEAVVGGSSIPHRPAMSHQLDVEFIQQSHLQSETVTVSDNQRRLLPLPSKPTTATSIIDDTLSKRSDAQNSDSCASGPPRSLPTTTSSMPMPPMPPMYHNHVEILQYPQVIPDWEPLGTLATSYRTSEEIEKLQHLRQLIQQTIAYPDDTSRGSGYGGASTSQWLRSINDVELIRFLRARSGDIEAASKMIFQHDEWRRSVLGPDTFTQEEVDYYSSCALNREVYWAGEALDGCPTVIVRTALHVPGGCDLEVYTRFIVWLLEIGRKKYGVGTHRQLCVIIDRSSPIEGELDGGAKSFTAMIPLFRKLFTVLQDNYPEILSRAYIVPVNWFFGTIYSTASAMVDERSRQKVTLVKESDKKLWWLSTFPAAMVPRAMGGQAAYPTYYPKEFYCNASYSIDTRQYSYY